MLIYLLLLLCPTSTNQYKPMYQTSLPLKSTFFTVVRLWIKSWTVGCMSYSLLLWHRNRSCTTTYELMNIMDIRSCCVVVAMVTSKSTKCSTRSVRVSSVTLPPSTKAKTVKIQRTSPTFWMNYSKGVTHLWYFWQCSRLKFCFWCSHHLKSSSATFKKQSQCCHSSLKETFCFLFL